MLRNLQKDRAQGRADRWLAGAMTSAQRPSLSQGVLLASHLVAAAGSAEPGGHLTSGASRWYAALRSGGAGWASTNTRLMCCSSPGCARAWAQVDRMAARLAWDCGSNARRQHEGGGVRMD
jgi:hypothetical protein